MGLHLCLYGTNVTFRTDRRAYTNRILCGLVLDGRLILTIRGSALLDRIVNYMPERKRSENSTIERMVREATVLLTLVHITKESVMF